MRTLPIGSFDIAQRGIDLEIFQQRERGDRGRGDDAKAHVRMARAKRRRQLREHAERGRDRRDRDLAGETFLECIDLLPHRSGIADDAARPVERALAFRRESLKARTALHQHDAEELLELLDAGRHRRLRHAAGFRGAPEMPLLRERQKKFKFIDHSPSLTRTAIVQTSLKNASDERFSISISFSNRPILQRY